MDTQNIESIYPLSPIQQGIFFHCIHQPESEAYFIQQHWTLDYRHMEVSSLKRAWQSVVNRHGILRTAFVWEHGGEPLQVVHRRADLPWEEIDWRDLPVDAGRQRLDELLTNDRRRGSNLSKAPLMRLTLVRSSKFESVLLWSYHHLILDGWAVSILLNEVFALYDAIKQGKQLDLPQPLPYRDYVIWSQKKNLSEAELFWRENLKGFTAPTPFGIDRRTGGSDREEAGYGKQKLELSDATVTALSGIARKNGLTLNTILQGTYALLLSRCSGENDVAFGTSVTGRPLDLPGAESMMGVFINTLPTRVRVDPDVPILSFLKQVQADQVEARQHEHTPLLRIQEWSEVPGGQPLFESIFSFERLTAGPDPQTNSLGPKMTHAGAFEKTNYPLAILAAPLGRDLMLAMCYHCARFEDATISRLLRQYREDLECIAADPHKQVSELNGITYVERHQLLSEWNDTASETNIRSTIDEIFAEQARKTPNLVAVQFEQAELSYAQLDRRANQLAHYLQEQGVGPNTLVGLCLKRSLEMVVGILGILKAGGAYVPLDPAYPQEPLEYMIEDSAPLIILTQAALRERLRRIGRPVLALDADLELLNGYPTDNPSLPAPGLRPEHLAYVIYTSGSTGRPKGVLNSHASVLNGLLWARNAYKLTSGDRVLQKTPFSFDVSVWEFLLPLFSGARLVMSRPGGHRDPNYLAEVIEREQITLVHFVPSMLQVFLEQGLSYKCKSLRRVLCSGEALPYTVQQRFAEIFPEVELHNLYGPTEAAVHVTRWVCQPGVHDGIVPIGHPIANTRIYILDRYLCPVPQGVIGQIYIGGVGVAKGYWKQPELTQERFLPDPFSETAKARMYKTGDLGRWLPEGTIEYVGRNDFQVKIRGFRIELGEVEAALLQYAGAKQAVVMACEDAAGRRSLVAYVVDEKNTKKSNSDLRECLRKYLPEHMVPSAFIYLNDLPVTHSGKIDRKSLPAPDFSQSVHAHEPPRTDTEKTLGAIWCNVLGLDRVGVTDNFFDLGGHSINAIQITTKAKKAGYKLSTKQIFELQTIEKIAQAVSAAGITGGSDSTTTSQDPIDRFVPLMPIQSWFFDLEFCGAGDFNIGMLIHLSKDTDTGLLRKALSEVVKNHGALSHRFKKDGNSWRQFIARRSEAVCFSEHDLAQVPGKQLEAAMESAAAAARAGLDITNGPVMQAILFRRDDSCCLAIIVHHLLCDIASLSILTEDIQAAYSQLIRGDAVCLEPEGTSYAQWSEALDLYSKSEQCKQELPYWTSLNWSKVHAVPLDGLGGENLANTADMVEVQFTEAETRALLKDTSRIYRAQITEVLLAGLVMGYKRWTGEMSMVVAVERHGREELRDDIELSRTVGWFTAMTPILLDLKDTCNGQQAVTAVKEWCRAVPMGGIGFGVLRYMSEDQETKTRMEQIPAPEISFNFLGQGQGHASPTDLTEEKAGLGSKLLLSFAGRRPFKLDVSAVIESGRLRTTIVFSNRLHHRSGVEALALYYSEAIKDLILQASSARAIPYTSADFPSARLQQSEIDELVAEMGSVED